jgi:DNA-binding transcriptional LysR family regulator
VDDLAGLPFIALNSRGPLGRALSDYLADAAVELNIVAWTETYYVARELVARGAGFTIADDVTARFHGAGKVRRIGLRPALKFNIKAMHLEHTPLSLGARRFSKHLGALLREYLDAA